MTRSTNLRATLMGGVILSALSLLSSPAIAQTSDDADEASTTGEIIVTAQRRAERLEDVPAAVVAVSGESLQKAGIARFQDLGNIATGVMIARIGTSTQPSIRGVTSLATSGGAEGNVGYYLDGFYIADLSFAGQDLVNLRDVQVLKGPQGSLYGRNATGGAILLQTYDPSDHLEGQFDLSYGTFQDVRASTYVSVPLSDKIAVNVSGYYRRNNGYIRDLNRFRVASFTPSNPYAETLASGRDSAPYENNSIRAKIKLQPTEDLTIVASYNHVFQEDARALTYAFNRGNILPSLLPVIDAARAAGIQFSTRRDRTSLNYRPFNITKGDFYGLMMEADLGDAGTITSHTSYLDKVDRNAFDFDGIAASTQFTNIASIFTRKAFTQALDYSYDGVDNLQLLAGALYYKDKSLQPRNFNNGVANPVGSNGDATIRTKYSISGYIDATYNFNDKVFLTVGARYTKDRKSIESFNDFGTPGVYRTLRGIDPATGELAAPAKTFNAFTPRVVLRYNITSGTNVYASYSKGFKAGAYGSASPLAPVKPEKITAYEVGIKTNQNGLRAELSGFYYDYRDLQLVSNVFVAGSANTQTVVNAVTSRIYGVDAMVAAPIGQVLNLRAGVSYLHARYRNFPGARGTNLSSTDGRNIQETTRNYVPQDYSGLQMLRSPDWSGNFGADFNLDAMGGKLVISGNGAFSSSFSPTNNSIFQYQATTPTGAVLPGVTQVVRKRRFLENGYVIGSVQANWTDPSGHFTVGVYSDNVFNTRYKIVSTGSAFGSYDIYNEPRMTGARFGFKY